MARIRSIKPEYFKHLKLFELEEETGLPLRVAFSALWTVADREGRFVWIPRQLKIDCLPYDEVDFSRVLDALSTRDFVRKYTVNGVEYGVIPAFKEHQVINNRESESKLPDPSNDEGLTRDSRVTDASTTPAQGKGKEGKGRERKGKDIKPTSENKFSDDHLAFASGMFKLIQKVAPKSKEPNFDKWADEIRLINEIDGHSLEEIAAVFRFANRDSFWKTNVLSPSSLRDKYAKLHANMLKDGGGYAPTANQKNMSAFKRFLDSDDQKGSDDE
ncbi:hypothetical protein A3765_28615 [Oleiphilus sp. HI0130]|nr:hypothetical protein A3765_28900 [Oleiphilus sp. HI0130]KZZ72516.1 hypothetical protein A3765_28615 [Oleiphilus sp. HI0130]